MLVLHYMQSTSSMIVVLGKVSMGGHQSMSQIACAKLVVCTGTTKMTVSTVSELLLC